MRRIAEPSYCIGICSKTSCLALRTESWRGSVVVTQAAASGASDPMAISLEPFERQFLDFGDAIRHGRRPRVGGEEGYQALEVVDAVYRSCRSGQKVVL